MAGTANGWSYVLLGTSLTVPYAILHSLLYTSKMLDIVKCLH